MHLAELDLAINAGLKKGSQYSLAWDMVDFRGRMLNIPRTQNEEPIHVPLDATAAAPRVVRNQSHGYRRVLQSVKTSTTVRDAAELLRQNNLMKASLLSHLGQCDLPAGVFWLRQSDTTSHTSQSDAGAAY